jgi:hypothetical protein
MPSYSSCPTIMVLPSFSPAPAATFLRSGYLLLGHIKILHINHTTRKQPSSQRLTTKYPLNLSHSTAAKVNSIELFTHQYVFSSDPRSRFFLYIFLHYFAFYFHNYTTLCSYVNMISSNTLYSPRPWQYIIIRTARLCSYRSKADDKLIKNKILNYCNNTSIFKYKKLVVIMLICPIWLRFIQINMKESKKKKRIVLSKIKKKSIYLLQEEKQWARAGV